MSPRLFIFCLCLLALTSAFTLPRNGESDLTKSGCPKIICFANGKCLDMCDPGVFPYLAKHINIPTM
ncbi:hypothetical protein TcasGA2_TC032299 [Tribolium castaneum]|uniref:Uncharacterized protein n=1 Tax=Tribolium castaneum TaxID=7070 RepID=A0A139WLS1_TRICA|nr:hypothetical protein TcasGA2_TC032299 [Tribolium castaneum]